MLDSSKDNLKLDAMKRIVSMMAKGRDVSDLFPQVVKNVASKNIEVKKLVYVYLTRYAEEQQDLALLSISTFQRALKDPNQLIRASALRVLSSIRVQMIVPIMLLAIRESAVDMSPFVRKTAAHAIPKLFSLDPETKEELVGVLEKLLGDRTTLVIGSAVMAFEEVCPDRIELIHKNYRKLISLLVDVEEWGQVVIVNMLTRYARTQFADPNLGVVEVDSEKEKEFYENSEDEEENDDDAERSTPGGESATVYKMDPDHRLLLRSARFSFIQLLMIFGQPEYFLSFHDQNICSGRCCRVETHLLLWRLPSCFGIWLPSRKPVWWQKLLCGSSAPTTRSRRLSSTPSLP